MNHIFCIVGPSGSGKTTLGEYLKNFDWIGEIVSHTTRKMRKNEEYGDPYYFVDENQFQNLTLIEEVKYGGNYYGFAKEEILDKISKYDVIFAIVDMHGVEQLQKEFPKANINIIYIYSTMEECINRMKKRDENKILKRLKHADKTNEFLNHKYADYIVRNKDNKLKAAKTQLAEIFIYETFERWE